MNRIDHTFAQLRAAGRTALIPFITAGDPALAATVPVMHALVAAGADLIELGVPFSDPMADGPVIQKASERALARGVDAAAVLAMVQRFRASDQSTPVVLMGYLNPVEIHGRDRFVAAAAGAGVDGLLLVDAPVEESGPLSALLQRHGMHQILLAAPTTTGARLERLLGQARGFLYYVAFTGVTGGTQLDTGAVAARLDSLRTMTTVPVAVGFGVRDAASAQALAGHADAVVVGSALVAALADSADADAAAAAATAFLAPLRAGLDAARAGSRTAHAPA
jgi:tryptophan synthase alpha chain